MRADLAALQQVIDQQAGLIDAEREKVRVLREALVGIRSWMPPSGSDPELDEAMCRVDHALATTEPKL